MDEAEIAEALRPWRAAHPQASGDEIETEVQRQLAGLQAAWMAQLAGAPSARGETREAAVPTCPACGAPMRPCGQRTRQVLTRMGRPVPLERGYYVCPACGAGLFPSDGKSGIKGLRRAGSSGLRGC